MYRNAYQRGMLTILFSGGTNPLSIWDVRTQDGYVSRFLDQDIKSMVVEIGGTNVSTTYITCPKGKIVLGITMPFLVMIVKNLKKYFSFEVTILDETSTRRRFRVSNFQSTTQILPLCTAMPIALSEGWNQIQFNLAEFCRRAYKKQFVEVQKLKINANIRLRRIYFAERLLPEEELPPQYKLYFPLASKAKKDKKSVTQEIANKENIEPSTSQPEAKPANVVPMEEKVNTDTAVVKPSSKTSVHSIKRVDSHVSKKQSMTNTETTTKEDATTEVSEKTDMTSAGEEPAAEKSNAPEGDVGQEVPHETVVSENVATEAEPTGESVVEQPVEG